MGTRRGRSRCGCPALRLRDMPADACFAMLGWVVRALWCRAHGHQWIDHGDVRTCARCDRVQDRAVTRDGARWVDRVG